MIMDMCSGDIMQHKTIMAGSVEDFLTKFEHYTSEIRRTKKEAEKLRAGQRKWHR